MSVLLCLLSVPLAQAQPSPAAGHQVTRTGQPSRDPTARPNIVLITTDDQNRSDLRWMAKTRLLLGGHGVTFVHALSPDPLCCPARAELVTGQLGQNNGVRSNKGVGGGFHALLDPDNTIAAWLHDAGYQTAMVGKYLNGYQAGDGPQTGWTIWNPTVAGVYSYDDTTFYNGGAPITITRNVSRVIADCTVDYIRRLAATGSPFFVWASHLAPHARSTDDGGFRPPVPTVGHRDDLADVRSPVLSKPSFNELGSRPWPYAERARYPGRDHIQHTFTRRIQSLLDVDDAVARIIATLSEVGQLDNTYVFLMSDNAELLGEHGLIGKDVLYREALEVPLVVRVPDVVGARTSGQLVATTDLAPTIVELAGATAGRLPDGTSLAGILRGTSATTRDTQLIQTGDAATGEWSFRGVRTPRFSYFRRAGDGVSFLYDHRRDPYELRNQARSTAYHDIRVELARRTAALQSCAGASCTGVFGPP